MAICPTCKAEVPDGSRFCQECGTRMTPSLPPQPSPVADSTPADEQPAAPASDPNAPTVLLPTANALEPQEQDDSDASNQPTVGLPPAPPANESGAKSADNAYRTVLLPAASAEELLKQEEEWKRLAEGQTSQPAAPQGDATPNRPPGGSATIITRDDDPLAPARPPGGSATIITRDDDLPAAATAAEGGPPASAEAATIMAPGAGLPSSEGATIMAPGPAPMVGAPSDAPPRPPTPPPFAAPPPGPEALPQRPPTGVGQIPPVAPPFGTGTIPQAPAAPQSSDRRQLYWILGGVGCLLMILLVACLIFFLLVIGSSASGGAFVAAATATTALRATRTLVVPTRTVGPGAAATLPPSGSAAISEDFSAPERSTLAEGDDKETSYAYEDGIYVITVKVPRLIAWSAFDGSFADARAQVQATLREGPSDAAAALIFRYQDSSNFYVYNVAADGRYNLEVMRNNNLTTLIDWTPSPAIKGKGETNLIRLETRGNRIALYVNDTQLEELSDSTFLKGQVALAVNTFDGGGATVAFDNVIVEAE